MRIRETNASDPAQRYCAETVRKPAGNTREWQHRVYKATKRGTPPEMCARQAVYIVDGRPLCRSHAGQAAIRILLSQKD